MRIKIGLFRSQTDTRQYFINTFVDLGSQQIAVDHQRLGHNRPHPHARTQRGPRVLKHRLHHGAKRLQVLAAHLVDLLVLHEDLTGRRLFQAQQQLGGRGLATSRLAHQRKRLSRLHDKADIIHRLDRTNGLHQQETFGHRKVFF